MEKKRILVVDDDPLICKMIKRCIRIFIKYPILKVKWAFSVRQAIKTIDNSHKKYSLVITDWDCSQENDGFKVVSCALGNGIHCIVYTGDSLSAKCFLKNYGIEIPIIDKVADITKLMEVINGIIIR